MSRNLCALMFFWFSLLLTFACSQIIQSNRESDESAQDLINFFLVLRNRDKVMLDGTWQVEKQLSQTTNQRKDTLVKESGFDFSQGSAQLFVVQREIVQKNLIVERSNAIHQNEDFKMTLKLYNGNYIDKWIQLEFNLFSQQLKINATESHSKSLSFNSLNASLTFGTFFEKGSISTQCQIASMTITDNLSLAKGNLNSRGRDINFKIQSIQSTCFSNHDLKYLIIKLGQTVNEANDSEICYQLLYIVLILIHIYVLREELKAIDVNSRYRNGFSIYTVAWSCAWTYAQLMFQLYYSAICRFDNYLLFLLVALQAILHFQYQRKLLIGILEDSYYSDFCMLISIHFLAWIFIIFPIGTILREDTYLILICSPILWPQVISNFVSRRKKNTVSLRYLFSQTTLQVFGFPLFFLSFPSDFLHIRPKPEPIYNVILPSIGSALLILTFQKMFGGRFCLPIRFRKDLSQIFAKCFNSSQVQGEAKSYLRVYQPMETEDSIVNEDCAICLMKIISTKQQIQNDLETSTNQSQQQDSWQKAQIEKKQSYIEIPCKHVYHIQCIKEWVKIKSECPSCRSQIPEEIRQFLEPKIVEVFSDDEY